MVISIRKTGKKVLFFCNIIIVVAFLLSCLAPVLNPSKWWLIAFLGLGFPFLFMLVAAFALFWAFLRKRIAWISVLALLMAWKNITVSFAFHKQHPFSAIKNDGDIRVVSWNVARFIEWKKNNNKGSQQRLKILEQIKQLGGDILCLQEFFHSPDSTYYNNIDKIQAMGYPYYYFSYDPDGWHQYIGSIIFSRFPIIDTGMVRYFRPSMPEALIYADIRCGNDTVRVFTTHLQSVQFRKNDYNAMEKVKQVEDSFFVKTKTVLGKVKKALKYRSTQSQVVRDILDNSPYPSILCGDFNDIPNSYTYFTIRGDMQDAFLQKGFGIGRTFSSLSPTLRIDYIFADDHFTIKQFQRIAKRNSDHYMLRADLKIIH
ncbi:MAG: endonuclease/exonuclease/phosphatase [Terrimonas sp.]|nr:endonuclease/exonuclease/phosphatase [Terrimonas sp.]